MRSWLRFPYSAKLLLVAALWFPLAASAQNDRVIFLVRHAERGPDSSDAALLNAAGEQRARCLAQTLRDSHIGKIYVTDIKRTQQTADPLAQELHLQPTVVAKANTSELLRDLKADSNKGVLVVGHADTLPAIVERLGAGSLSSNGVDYDLMMIVPVVNGKIQSLVAIHYCIAAK